jgi:hypothetical protein
MIREIDPRTHAVVDLRSCTEIPGAVAVDTDTGEVHTVRKTGQYMDELVEGTEWFPDGAQVVRR